MTHGIDLHMVTAWLMVAGMFLATVIAYLNSDGDSRVIRAEYVSMVASDDTTEGNG